MANGVLRPVLFSPEQHGDFRLFKSRLVCEIKARTTDSPYEKSQLVVHDDGKRHILTQSPTVQRCSQRLLLALVPSLRKIGMMLTLRDITQAYPRSKSSLIRKILARIPKELEEKYPEGTVLEVMKPLYGIAEAGVHWFVTYQGHHETKLHMATSAYDPCLFITDDTSKEGMFVMVALQTDDSPALGTSDFLAAEESELQKADFKAKPLEMLNNGVTGDFNGCRVYVEEE